MHATTMRPRRRQARRPHLALLALVALLAAACFPIDPSRQDAVDRGIVNLQALAAEEAFGPHGVAIQEAVAALSAVPEIQGHSDRMGQAQLELIGTPPGPEADALRAEIESLAQQTLTEPAAADEVAALLAALQALRDDVAVGDLADATMRGYADAMDPPGGLFIPKVGIFGDSGALTLKTNSAGYTGWRNGDKKLRLGEGWARLGCGIMMTNSTCGTPEQWAAQADDNATHLALVYAGYWETDCWQFEDWTECHQLGEPVFDDFIRRTLDERTEALLGAGVPLVVYVKTNDRRLDDGRNPERQVRWDRWRALVDEHAARYDHVIALDLVPWWHADPARDLRVRPDGYHFEDGALEFWEDALEPMLYWDLWRMRFGLRGHTVDPWVPILGHLWAQTTPPPLITGPGLTTTTTTSPPTTATSTTSTTTSSTSTTTLP